MSDARTRILNRLRRTPQRELRPLPNLPIKSSPSRQALIAQFRAMIEAVHGETQVVDKDDWLTPLKQVLVDHKVEQLLIGTESWPGNAIIRQPPPEIGLVACENTSDGWKERLFHQIDASVTSAAGAIAETGSIALWPSAEEPRLMSLVPPLHIVLLKAEQIFATFNEIIEQQNWAANLPTNALLISGPSKSADIEQVLAYGVHGPKSLVVLILT